MRGFQGAAVTSFMVLQGIHFDEQKKTEKILCHFKDNVRPLRNRKTNLGYFRYNFLLY